MRILLFLLDRTSAPGNLGLVCESRASFPNNTSHARLMNARYRETQGTQATIQASKRNSTENLVGITETVVTRNCRDTNCLKYEE